MHSPQTGMDTSRGIETSYCKISARSITVHPAMLDRCVLPGNFGIPSVEKTNDVGNRHAAVERLATDIDIERTTLTELARVVKQQSQLIIRVNYISGDASECPPYCGK